MGITSLDVGGVKGHLARDSSSSDIRGLQRGLILLQAREWSLRGTGREEDVEPVTHVPAEQVVDGCEEAGLQYQRHHCDHYSVPDLHFSVGKRGNQVRGCRGTETAANPSLPQARGSLRVLLCILGLFPLKWEGFRGRGG